MWEKIKIGARSLHIYLSLLGLLLFLFFSITGFMMNHPDWFGIDETVKTSEDGEIPLEYLKGPDEAEIIMILQNDYGLLDPLHGFDIDDRGLHVYFKRPGRESDAFINRKTGRLEIEIETSNILRFFTDVHMKQNTGTAGRWLLDITV